MGRAKHFGETRYMTEVSPPSYCQMLWCGRLPVLDYAGGIIISRQRTDREMPGEVEKEFRRVLTAHGLDYDKTCPSNNDHCPY